ncbi:homing endonuclease [Escherichia phage BEK26]|nr:homing endonuclease [Escherichia phage BEK12A]QGH77543.1 homing endonuclease [Escherichia phage BEK26]
MNWHDIFYIEDDKLFNKVDRGARAMAGKEAGCLHKNSGYVVVRVDDKLLKAHRIIYEMRHGAIPEGMEVDHIDHNRSNNSDSNHRLVTHKENTQNVTRRKTNNSGCTGVYWYESRSKWWSFIGTGKGRKSLGYYSDWFDAVCARKRAEFELGYHENHGKK